MKKHKRKPQPQAGYAPSIQPTTGGPLLIPQASIGSFQGADFTTDRGYVWLPTLDSKREVDSWSRRELMKRSKVLYNSGGGLIHRGVNGIARMICGTGLMPHPMTGNKGLDKEIRLLWNARCGSAATFDISRKYNVNSAQPAIVRGLIKDGDDCGVLAREEEDDGTPGRLRMALYEANQIGLGSANATDQAGWHDGVKLGQHNAPIAYNITGEDQGKVTSVEVPAQNVLFCANDERIGQVRGLTRFYPVLNECFDLGEIKYSLTSNIKATYQTPYVLEQHAPQAQNQTPGDEQLAPRSTRTVKTQDGKTVTLEQFLSGSGYWALQPGQQFKMVEATNPNPNVSHHLAELIRSIAWALGYSPELLWSIIELGGANTRFVMSDAQSAIEEEQERLVEQFLAKWYCAWLMDMIQSGQLKDPGPTRFLHSWLTPKRLTVDFGKDGKLFIEQHKRGLITLKNMYGFTGEEWQVEVDQYLDERAYIKEGLLARDLTWEEAFPELRQTPIAPGALEENAWDLPGGQQEKDPGQEDEDPEDKPKKKPAPVPATPPRKAQGHYNPFSRG